MMAGETAALRHDLIGDEAVAMQVAEDEHASIGFGEIVAVIDGETRVGMAAADGVGAFRDLQRIGTMDTAAGVVRVVGDRLDVVVGERIEMLAGLALIAGGGQDVVEVRDHAGRVEELAARVVIETPRVARPFGEDLEDMAGRVIAPDAGVDLHALLVGRAGLAHDRVGEDAVVAVEPAVRTPHEAVERLVRVMEAPSVEEHDRRAGLVVGVLGDEEEFRRRADPHAAVADFDARDEVESVLEDRDLRERTVLLHVLEDEDAIVALPVRTLLRIGHALHDPETAALVEAHRDRLDDLRLGRDERHLEAGGQRHRLHRVGRRLPGLVGRGRHAVGRTGRQGRGGDAGGNEEEREESHGGVRHD